MKRRGLLRLRLGELLALTGTLCIGASLSVGYYAAPHGQISAWQSFGPAVVLLMIAGLAGLELAIATALERSTAVPVASAVWATWLGLAGLIAAFVRLLERPGAADGLAAGAWLALAGALCVLVGGWQAMRDERTSSYEPPEIESRPAPEPQQ